MLRESRRVEDDEIVLVVGIVKKLEGIFTKSLVTGVTREVERHVAVGQFDGLGTAVNRMNQAGTTAHSIEREAARIAEHVQHPPVAGIAFEQRTVLTLVNEKARLLSAQPVNIELQPILDSNIVGALTIEEPVLRIHEG